MKERKREKQREFKREVEWAAPRGGMRRAKENKTEERLKEERKTFGFQDQR